MGEKKKKNKLVKFDLITRSDSDGGVFCDKLSANALRWPQLASQLYESACIKLKKCFHFSLLCQKHFLVK